MSGHTHTHTYTHTSLGPRPFSNFCHTHAQQRGRGERKGSGDTTYPSADPGRNAAVGVKYAISNPTTAAVPLYYISTALLYSIIIYIA